MFRQDINLYHPLEPTQIATSWLNWKRLWSGYTFFLALLLLMSLSSLWHIHRLNVEKVDLHHRLSILEEKFSAAKTIYPALFFADHANQSLAEWQQNLQVEEKILETIQNKPTFSQHLIALSRLTVANVWLTDIIFLKGGQEVLLKGESVRMENIQLLLTNILHDPLFSGFKVNLNNIENADEQASDKNLQFEISMTKKTL